MARIRTKEIPRRTIAESLLTIWQHNRRKGDIEKIMQQAKDNKLPSSKPTIENAILYGHCLDESLRDIITEYFEKRNRGEDKMAWNLKHKI